MVLKINLFHVFFLSGDYSCVADNDHGEGVSNPLTIKVLCELLLRNLVIITNKQNIDKMMFIYPTPTLVNSLGQPKLPIFTIKIIAVVALFN